jgi:hypothetical protein
MTRPKQSIVTCCFLYLLYHLEYASAFLFVASQRSRVITPCFANKKTQGAGTAGKGFGSASSSSSPELKVRSLSNGRSGSGTKVLRKAANLFDDIRKELGPEACNDVYVRAPANSETTLWFVGKVAFRGSATAQQAAVAQKRVILEYSKSELRPQNLGGSYSKNLELWLAPGDSEMDVVRNVVELEQVKGSASDLPDDEDFLNNVGFNPEIYVGDERLQGGFRVERDAEGKPIKPTFEVNESV